MILSLRESKPASQYDDLLPAARYGEVLMLPLAAKNMVFVRRYKRRPEFPDLVRMHATNATSKIHSQCVGPTHFPEGPRFQADLIHHGMKACVNSVHCIISHNS